MKKLLAVILAAACLLAFAVTAASADGGTWRCVNCGEDRDTAFCPVCGAARPAEEEEGTWTCPSCGKELPDGFAFCPDDGTRKEADSEKPWEVISLEGKSTALRGLGNPDDRHQSYFGPSRDYPGDGAYKPARATRVTALFREGDYVLTDMTYTTVGRRILYFKASSLKDSDVAETRLTGHPARTTVRLMPRQGPGTEYDNVMETKKQDLSSYEYTDITSYSEEAGEWITYTGWVDYDTGIFISDPKNERYLVYLNENMPVSVFFETDGWVFAEFSCSLGTVRAWLPAECVTAE